MHFGAPQNFWFLFLLPLIVGVFIFTWQRRTVALGRFVNHKLVARLTPGSALARNIIKWTLMLCALLFLVFALVRPQFGVKMEMIERKGVDIMVALDISKSMLAEDVAPNRLERAEHEIAKLIDLLKGDRIGIIAFAGESFVQCPLTLDYGAAKMYLNALNPDWVQLGGTAMGDAIEQASKAFRSKLKKHKVLIIISDGEDHQGNTVEAAQKAADEGVRIYTVGVGSENGVPIPETKAGGNVVYKKDRAGNLVMTKLDPAILEKIALEGHGTYMNAGTNFNLSAVYDEITKMEKKDLGMNKMSIYEERYQLFLFIALVLLLVEFFVPLMVKRSVAWRGRFEQ